MSINNRVNQLYRRKVDNIYNNPNLQIEEKYGVSNTHRTAGGFPNNTKYDILTGSGLVGGMTKEEDMELRNLDKDVRGELKTLIARGATVDKLKNPQELEKILKKKYSRGAEPESSEEEYLSKYKNAILEALKNPILEKYYRGTQKRLKEGPSKETVERARKSQKDFRISQMSSKIKSKMLEEKLKTPEGQKELLTQEVEKALLSKLDRQQKGAFLGEVDKWEKDPLGADILFGIVDFGKNIARPVLGLLNEIGKKVLPGAVGKIAEIALGIGDSIIKGAEAQNQAFDIYRQLRKDKKINSFVNGSKRGFGKLKGGNLGQEWLQLAREQKRLTRRIEILNRLIRDNQNIIEDLQRRVDSGRLTDLQLNRALDSISSRRGGIEENRELIRQFGLRWEELNNIRERLENRIGEDELSQLESQLRSTRTTRTTRPRIVGSGKRERRAELVRKIMKEKGLSLPKASKYIKENNLQY